MKFLITGAGRSGTLFLARELAKGNAVVTHEYPEDDAGKECPAEFTKTVRDRFSLHKRYGEVNSYLLHIGQSIQVDFRYLIIRNPYDLLLSRINKHPKRLSNHSYVRMVKILEEVLLSIEGMRSITNAKLIYFKDLIVDPGVIKSLSEDMGLGIDENDIDMTPTNSSKRIISSLKSLHPDYWDLAKKHLQWFFDSHPKEKL